MIDYLIHVKISIEQSGTTKNMIQIYSLIEYYIKLIFLYI